MVQIEVLNNTILEDVPVINVSMSNAIYRGPQGEPGKDYVLTEDDKKEIADMIEVSGGGDVNLDNYYTKSQVDDLIEIIELTPGPAGEPGPAGKDYVLTAADKEEIASMVPGADVDLTDYYTKTEIAALGYQTEEAVIALINEYASGEPLPQAEGVKF